MTTTDALAVLRQHEPDLRARGVRHAAIFGSVARGEAGPASDIDILITLDRKAEIDVFAYAGLKTYIGDLFSGPVDVVNRDALKHHLRDTAAQDAVYAF